MKLGVHIIIGCVAIAGCAKQPSAIVATNYPFEAYMPLSCDEIQQSYYTVIGNLAALESQQKNAVVGDAVGVFLIGVPTASLLGGDQEGNLALEKGKLNALQAAHAAKTCPAPLLISRP
jgi:hypothetical protein